jgi:hypothetical protein
MPEINPSLYPQPPQPGAAAGLLGRDPAQLVGILGQVNALQQSQQNFAARKAAGQALQSSVTVNPDGTTTVDPDKAAAAVAADPNAALAASDVLPTIANLRTSNIANSTGKVTMAATQNQYLASMLNGFAADPSVTPSKVTSAMVSWARQGGMDSPTLTAMMAGMPQQGGAPLQAWARKIGNFGMTPIERAQQVDAGVDATGAGRKSALDLFNAGTIDAGVPPQKAGAPPLPGQPPPGAAIPGIVRTTLPPPVTAQMQADQAAFSAAQARSAGLSDSLRPISNAIPVIEGLSQQNFGPAAKGINNFKSFMSTIGALNPQDSELPEAQIAKKYLHQIVGVLSTSDRSDKSLAQNVASNPDMDLTKLANLAVLKKNYGYTAMDLAKPALFQAENPNNPTNAGFQAWNATANNKYDDRAFQLPVMNKADVTALQTSLGPASTDPKKPNLARQKFENTLRLGYATGTIPRPQAPQPAQPPTAGQ